MSQPPHDRRFATVPARAAGQRLDRFLVEHFPNYSRRQIAAVLRSAEVRVAGRTGRPGTVLAGGERLDLPVMSQAVARLEARAEKTARLRQAAEAPREVDVLHRDDDLLVVSKPPGVPVHGGARLSRIRTLLELLKDDVVSGFRLVHRLDKDTTGVIALVRGEALIAATAERFADPAGPIEKTYEAIVDGVPEEALGDIEFPLTLPGHRGRVQISEEHGRPAHTRFTVVEAFSPVAARLRVQLFTGRTHQIRAHLAGIGHPLLVDRHYGKRGGWRLPDPRGKLDARLRRTPLHATELTLPHPRTEDVVSFRAPLPPDMKYALEVLRVQTAHAHRDEETAP